MKKIVYIIPGYGESHLKQRAYNKIAKIFQDYNINPVQVEINWGGKSPASFKDYNNDFLEVYKKPKDTDVYILGFSFGAMIAYLTSLKTKPKILILCSLSPYFEEDMKNMNKSDLRWWRQNFIDSDYNFNNIASNLKCEVYLVVGDKEHKSCLYRAKVSRNKIRNSHLFIAKGAQHKVGQHEYLGAIRRVISRL